MLQLSFAINISVDVPPDISTSWTDQTLSAIQTYRTLLAAILLLVTSFLVLRVIRVPTRRIFSLIQPWLYGSLVGHVFQRKNACRVRMQAGSESPFPAMSIPSIPSPVATIPMMPIPTLPMVNPKISSKSVFKTIDRSAEERSNIPKPPRTNASQRAAVIWYPRNQ